MKQPSTTSRQCRALLPALHLGVLFRSCWAGQEGRTGATDPEKTQLLRREDVRAAAVIDADGRVSHERIAHHHQHHHSDHVASLADVANGHGKDEHEDRGDPPSEEGRKPGGPIDKKPDAKEAAKDAADAQEGDDDRHAGKGKDAAKVGKTDIKGAADAKGKAKVDAAKEDQAKQDGMGEKATTKTKAEAKAEAKGGAKESAADKGKAGAEEARSGKKSASAEADAKPAPKAGEDEATSSHDVPIANGGSGQDGHEGPPGPPGPPGVPGPLPTGYVTYPVFIGLTVLNILFTGIMWAMGNSAINALGGAPEEDPSAKLAEVPSADQPGPDGVIPADDFGENPEEPPEKIPADEGGPPGGPPAGP